MNTVAVKYPTAKIKVILSGPQGNAYAIIGMAVKALRKVGAPEATVSEYREKALSSHSYEQLKLVTAEYVNVTWVS